MAKPVKIEVVLHHPHAIVPHRSRESDAGYDVHALDDALIEPGSIVNIDTGLSFIAPSGWYFTVEGRSSLYKAGVAPFRGIIDGTYTGTITVSLMNVSKLPYWVLRGDRVAQLIPHVIVPITSIIVDEPSEDYSIRGKAGFGSSGK